MNCLIIVGPSITGRRESEIKIHIRTYSNSITSVCQGVGGIEDYTEGKKPFNSGPGWQRSVVFDEIIFLTSEEKNLLPICRGTFSRLFQ